MSIQTLLIAAQYLDYKAETEARGEEPQDYNSFLSDGYGVDCLSISGSEHECVVDSLEYSETKHNSTRANGKGSTAIHHEKSISREVHNRLEKNRRAQMKEGFETLKQLTPNIGSTKVSNLKLLREVTKYIKDLNDEHATKTTERKHLTMRNDALNSRREYLMRECSSKHESLSSKITRRNHKIVSSAPVKEQQKPNEQKLEDEKSLLLFSHIATSSTDLVQNNLLNMDQYNSYSDQTMSSSPVVQTSCKSEAELRKQSLLSVCEELLSTANVEKSDDQAKVEDPALSMSSITKTKRKFCETKDHDPKLIKLQVDERVKLTEALVNMSKPVEIQCKEQEVVVATSNVATKKYILNPNVQGFKNKFTEEVANSKAASTATYQSPVIGQLHSMPGQKSVPSVNESVPIGANSSSEHVLVVSPLTVVGKIEAPAAREECDSILQKVLQNDVKYSEALCTAKGTTVVTPPYGVNEPPIQPKPPAACVQNCSTVVTDFAAKSEAGSSAVKVQSAVEQLIGMSSNIENGTKIGSVVKCGQTSSVICSTNGNTVKLACGIPKPDTSKAFQNLKVNPSFPENNGILPNTQNRVIIDGNDAKLYFVALQNPTQRIYINGSKA